ncbi:HDL533Wp [Eremothecium sinecaudum]|uniref:HDL533Wp n=1 Tax=Eremothecium sinecaudum TaxID=45286 RepID=A0A0X8HRQ7_9SACH|nr:HDL533Wp [Eremothecium sinecaudum]AMD20211.1 HDL533Wp [Eremothecium sinecaudum]
MSKSDEDLTSGLRELRICKGILTKGVAVSQQPNVDDVASDKSDNKQDKVAEGAEDAELHHSDDLVSDDDSFGEPEITGAWVQEEQGTLGEDTRSSSDEEWQTMPAIASYDVYDPSGELAVPTKTQELADTTRITDNSGTQESGFHPREGTFGYTKAAAEEQAQRAHATNKKTDFLFGRRFMDSSMTSLGTTGSSGEIEGSDAPYTAARSAEDQLSLTKTLLTEKEKFAYLGAVSVLVNEMCTYFAQICICSKNVTNDKKLAHRLQNLQKRMAEWKSTLCNLMYAHLDIQPEEIEMVEKLSLHGIELPALCKCLKTSRVVENPWAKGTDGISLAGDIEEVTTKQTLEVDVAWTIICDLFLLLVQDSNYDARSRTLLIKFAGVLDISRTEICEFEKQVTDILELEQSTEEQVWDEKEHMDGRRKEKRKKKLAYVGLATIGGSLILGLSGGLLAPVIGAGLAAGLSTIGVGGATGFLTGVGGTTVVAVSSTAIGANIGRKAMSRRMGSVKTFEFKPLHNNRRVNLMVSVSGWMIGKADDVRLPFSPVDPIEGDLYSLSWEPDMLKSTGQTINILASEIVTQTIQQILGATVLTALIAAIQVPNLLSKLGYIIDNPWNVSLDRAWAAGLVLADTLMARNLGRRPCSLVGFSLGSRVIYSCLLELSKKGAIGLVEDVYLFGSPMVYNRDEMVLVRAAVSGRFVNGYSDRDWVLGYLFRATGGGIQRVAGISPITEVEGIENMNCTELVEGHMAYRKNIPSLLKKLGISVISEEFTEIDDSPDPEQVARQRKLVTELQDAQNKLTNKKSKKAKVGWVPKWFKPKKQEWQEMYEKKLKGNQKQTTNVGNTTTVGTSEQKAHTDLSIVDNDALVEELQHLKDMVVQDMPLHAGKGCPIPNTNNMDSHKLEAQSATNPVSPNNSVHSDPDETRKEASKEEQLTFAFADDI